MSLFADFEVIDRPKAKPKKTNSLESFIAHHINDQRRILNGEEVPTTNGKSLKKSWWNQDKGFIDARIGVTPIIEGKVINCDDEQTFKKFLNVLENYEKNKELKKRLGALYENLTKPKNT